MIVIVSAAADVHARAVADALRSDDHAVAILDTEELGEAARLDYPIGNSRSPMLQTSDGVRLSMLEVRSIWYRRPRTPAVPVGVLDPDDRRFIRQEWLQSFEGLLMALQARTINPLPAQAAAVKLRQLELAARVGLRIPDTLVTNDPARVEAFVSVHGGRVVHKTVTAPAHRFIDARSWSHETAAALVDLPLAPAVFQEEVCGPADIRATVVGEEVLAARIETSESRAGIDSRLDLDVPCTRYDLPTEIQTRLLRLMRELRLVFGTIDLKLADDGDHVFFEVNPQGQFLYIEILTGLPITASVARLLART